MNEAVDLSPPPSPLQQAGIGQREVLNGQVSIREVTELALTRVRCFDSPSAADMPISELPTATGRCAGTDPVFLCLGPREWLVLSKSAAPPQLLLQVQSAVDPTRVVACDLTDGIVALRLTGAAAPWLLGKLSCLDFLAGTKRGQHCARTRLGDAAVTLHYHQPTDDTWAFDIFADRSIAAYLWSLLLASAPHANELTRVSGAPE